MKFATRYFTWAAILACTWPAAGQRQEPAAVIQSVENRLLAPCCYRQRVAIHISPEASAMRAEIRRLAQAGKSEAEIIGVFRKIHGSQILAEPEGAAWWVGTLVPLCAILAGGALVVRLIRAWRQSTGSLAARPT